MTSTLFECKLLPTLIAPSFMLTIAFLSYTRPKGKLPDYTAPVVLRRGKCSVEDFCNGKSRFRLDYNLQLTCKLPAIHKEIAKQFKHAIVWGASAKHARGQKVGLDHIMEDEDVICIYKK
jgi:ribosome-interacting GTPase 1